MAVSSDAGETSAEDVRMDLELILEDYIESIMETYASYVITLRKAIKKIGVSPEDFHSFLVQCPAIGQSSIVEIKQHTTIASIFDFLTTECTSFLNYTILEMIQDHYGIGDELYHEHVKSYIKKHKVSEFFKINPLLKNYADSEKLILIFDVKMTCSLAKVSDLQVIIARILKINPSELQIIDIEDACKAGPSPTDVVSKGEESDEESEEEFIRKINKAFRCGEEIARRLAHAMLVGPPGSGKSSLMYRLLHREIKKNATSTDVTEDIVTVEIRLDEKESTFHAAIVMDGEWKEFEFNDSLFSHMSFKMGTSSSQPVEGSSRVVSKLESSQLNEGLTEETVPPNLENTALPSRHEPVISSPKQYHLAQSMVSYLRKKHGTYKEFKKYLKRGISLYLRDTGGQVEFQEILPLLLFGPSIFLFVFRLDLEFNEKFEVKYRQEDRHFNDYTSSITLEVALLQCLVTVDSTRKTDRACMETREPFVFVVGTHKDKLKKKLEIENGPSVEEEICQKNLKLDTLLEKHGFKDLVCYAGSRNDPQRVMFTVDNTSEDETDIELIRSRINAVITSRDEFLIRYPINYLLFCLSLMQNVKDNIIFLQEFREQASIFAIEGDEKVSELLHFLCDRIGIIQHFNKEGVNHIIVNKPQFLYKKVSNLIIETFKGKTLSGSERMELEKGILSLKAAKSIIGSESKITTKELLDLLVQLRIIAQFEDEKFFIPCILNHLPEASNGTKPEDSVVAPLYILFGCKYCPKGLFGVLVTYLISLKDSTLSLKFNQDGVFKDQVSFEVESGDDDLDSLTLRVVSCSSLQISIFPEKRNPALITNVCNTIRCLLGTYLSESFKDLHYNMEMVKYKFCLKCRSCSEYHKVLHTNTVRCKNEKILIPLEGKYWFEGETSQLTCQPSLDSEAALPQAQPMSLPQQHTTLGKEDFTKINCYLKDLKIEELIELGQTLGLKRATLQKSSPQSLAGDLIECWLRRDYRVLEESGEPTWHSLATALKTIELNGISRDIQKDNNFSL